MKDSDSDNHAQSRDQFEDTGETAPLTLSQGLGVPEEDDTPAVEAEVIDAAPAVDAFYDSVKKEYLLRNSGGRWLAHREAAFKRLLKARGFSDARTGGLTEVEREMVYLQDAKDVQYAGRLCGKREGFYEQCGSRFLVTQSFTLAEPEEKGFPLISALLDGLLGGDKKHGETQVAVFNGWMRAAQVSLRAEKIQPGQALAIAGPKGCGKSLLQGFITSCLGGRVAKPYRYMCGATPFNGELFEAEHLVLDDEHMSRKISDRLQLAASIKQFTVSTRAQSCHPKNRQAVTLPAWWRISITLNDEPDAMLVLPPLDDHVADKVILLRASPFDFPMPMRNAEEQEAFMDALAAEISGYFHWLLNAFTLPGHLEDPLRYGVASWHHPELRAALDDLSPEADLLALIDEIMWDTGRRDWRGTTEELQRLLFSDDLVSTRAKRLLEWRNACGTFLGRLCKQPVPRVRETRTAMRREYVITAPPSGNGNLFSPQT